MVGILLSYWGGLFSGAMLVSGSVHDMIFSLEKKICPFGTRPFFRGDTVSFSGGDYMMLHEFQEIIDQDQIIKLAHGTKPMQLRGYMFDNIHRWVCFLLLGKGGRKSNHPIGSMCLFYHYTKTRSSLVVKTFWYIKKTANLSFLKFGSLRMQSDKMTLDQ